MTRGHAGRVNYYELLLRQLASQTHRKPFTQHSAIANPPRVGCVCVFADFFIKYLFELYGVCVSCTHTRLYVNLSAATDTKHQTQITFIKIAYTKWLGAYGDMVRAWPLYECLLWAQTYRCITSINTYKHSYIYLNA